MPECLDSSMNRTISRAKAQLKTTSPKQGNLFFEIDVDYIQHQTPGLIMADIHDEVSSRTLIMSKEHH